MPPQVFLEELRQIRADIQSGELTPEDKRVLLQQVEKMKDLILELKGILLKDEKSTVQTN